MVSNLKGSNGKEYRVKSDALKPGAKLYVDRDYTYKSVQGEVKGAFNYQMLITE